MSKVKHSDINNILSDLAFTYSINPNNQILEDSLHAAAIIMQIEYKQKGDWYNALVASIFGYLQETDGSIPYDQMALELANRIVGIEPDAVEDTEGGPEDYEF